MAEPEDEKKPDDDEPEEPDDDEDDDEPDLEKKIENILERVLPKFLKKGAGAKEADPVKRKTYRDEEDSLFEKVDAKVDELLSLEKKRGEHHPEPDGEKKAPVEAVPAAPRRRRVESALWG